jgi:hypothetical protein
MLGAVLREPEIADTGQQRLFVHMLIALAQAANGTANVAVVVVVVLLVVVVY